MSNVKEKINSLKKDNSACKKLIDNYCSIKKVQEINEKSELFKKISSGKKEIIYD